MHISFLCRRRRRLIWRELKHREDEVAIRVLVVGSLRDPHFISKHDEFAAACRELGAALARAGMKLPLDLEVKKKT